MIKEKHLTGYGKVNLVRIFCKDCNGMTIVLKDQKQCCDEPVDQDLSKKYEVMVTGKERRKLPKKNDQIKILTQQRNKCFYCEAEFGSLYMRDGVEELVALNWDHIIPYVYTQGLSQEFVASCAVCNKIKSSKMFNSLWELKDYVNSRREKKGIKNLS